MNDFLYRERLDEFPAEPIAKMLIDWAIEQSDLIAVIKANDSLQLYPKVKHWWED